MIDVITSIRQHTEPCDMAKKDKSDSKRNTSLRLEKKTLKALKLRAIEEDTSVQAILEGLIEDYLARTAQPPSRRARKAHD